MALRLYVVMEINKTLASHVVGIYEILYLNIANIMESIRG